MTSKMAISVSVGGLAIVLSPPEAAPAEIQRPAQQALRQLDILGTGEKQIAVYGCAKWVWW